MNAKLQEIITNCEEILASRENEEKEWAKTSATLDRIERDLNAINARGIQSIYGSYKNAATGPLGPK